MAFIFLVVRGLALRVRPQDMTPSPISNLGSPPFGPPKLGSSWRVEEKEGEEGAAREREDEEEERAEEPMEKTRVTEEWNVQRERERWKRRGGASRRCHCSSTTGTPNLAELPLRSSQVTEARIGRLRRELELLRKPSVRM